MSDLLGKRFRHFKGHLYDVVDVVKSSEDLSEVVIYQNVETGERWSRPVSEFVGNKGDVRRFEPQGPTPRPAWPSYFMGVAQLVARRATCDRKHVGAVAVDDARNIVCTGYNGAPPGLPHCDDVGHDLRTLADGSTNCVRVIHAEQNLVYQAARRGVTLRGAGVYVNTFPCWDCAKALVGAGIKGLVYDADYKNDTRVVELFSKAGVRIHAYKAVLLGRQE